MTIQLDSQQRRRFLRSVLLTGTAASSAALLAACGGGGSSPGINSATAGNSSNNGNANGVGNDPAPRDCSAMVPRGELTLPSGPLAGIGELQDADENLVRLPEGFTSRIVAQNNSAALAMTSSTNYTWHAFPDGGATYPTDSGGWIYTSNSEVLVASGGGGAGALVFNANGDVIDAYSILTGTTMNCAGGKTPWNTWISCEETGSGQCWECDPYNPGQGIAKPALGLFAHEGCCIDPNNSVVYLTEDTGNGRFFRWVADEADIDSATGRMAFERGKLQLLTIECYEDGGYESDASNLRDLMRVTWEDAPNPEEPQGNNRGPGTRFNGGEGIWYYRLPEAVRTVPPKGTKETVGLVFFTTKGDNRVWAFDIENQLIELIFDNEQIDPDFNQVDNLVVSKAGDILVAEDGSGVRIMVVIPNEPAKVLVQLTGTHTASEICGPAFSPDGSRLYFSSQRGPDAVGGTTGNTFEITIPEQFRPTAAQLAANNAI